MFNGLGLGHLVWAAKLAKTGERVPILEKNTLSGGFASLRLPVEDGQGMRLA